MKITKAKEPKLIRYDAMVLAIEAARDVDDAKEIRDQAKALETYAKQALDRDQERKVIEIRIRAERRVGQLLREMEKAKGGKPRQPNSSRAARGKEETLADHGISHDQSSDWQKLATIPAEKFEAGLKDPDGMPSTRQILANSFPRPPMDERLEGAIRKGAEDRAFSVVAMIDSFQVQGILASDPKAIWDGMRPKWREDMYRLVPEVILWLRKLVRDGKRERSDSLHPEAT